MESIQEDQQQEQVIQRDSKLDAMEDTSKRSNAADLDADFRTMRLEDAPSPKPEQLQVPVPTTRADVLQQFEVMKQYWPPQPPSHAVGGSSVVAEYASILGFRSPSRLFATHFGPHSPRFNALAATFPLFHPSVSPLPPSMPSSSANQHYQPKASASPPAWDHNLGLNPVAVAPPAATFPFHPSVSPLPPSMPSSSTNQHYQPTPSASPPAWDHNLGLNPVAVAPPAAMPAGLSYQQPQPRTAAASLAPRIDHYASAFLNQLHAYNQVGFQQWRSLYHASMPTLQDVRSRLLRSQMDPALVMSPHTAAHVVRLLQEGRDEVRRSVLAGVMRAVHSVMESLEAHEVFLTLLRVCEVRFDELGGIVHAVCGGKDCLLDIIKQEQGLDALKSLIMAAAPYQDLSEMLIVWFLGERLTEHSRCGELLNHCFACIPYETCSSMIRFAIENIDVMLSSASGSIYLADCFANAWNAELHILEQMLLGCTSKIAMGQYSNYFLQRVLESGSDALKESIAERVAADVFNLSLDKFGSYVVEACFLLTCSFMPMRRVLVALLTLPKNKLAQLVRGEYSNYVVHKLLAAGKRPFPEQTTALAQRIQKLPAAVHRDMHAQRVMRIVRKQIPGKTY